MGRPLVHVLQRNDEDARPMDDVVRRFWGVADRAQVRAAASNDARTVVDLGQWARARGVTPRQGASSVNPRRGSSHS